MVERLSTTGLMNRARIIKGPAIAKANPTKMQVNVGLESERVVLRIELTDP
jgi:hypothetical protein